MDSSPTLREMGRIVQPHGIAGELKIAPETDDPNRFHALKTIYVGSSMESTTSFDILSVRLQPSKYGITVVVKLAGINSRDEVEKLKKLKVFAMESDLPKLEDGEYYFSDLIDMLVCNTDKSEVGVVIDVIEGPGQNLLVVSREGKPNAMIPMVEEFIVEIDFDSNLIFIDPIEGLL
ncbi:MAG: ribosome maturation factor RimM [Bacteroidetes bacterium]|nr:ribosome maturation factor RimM [Bacteroidota bacterium]